jgi:hypothetical protein
LLPLLTPFAVLSFEFSVKAAAYLKTENRKLFPRYLRAFLGLRSRMALESARRRKLAELVTDHILCHVDWQVTFAVMHAKS